MNGKGNSPSICVLHLDSTVRTGRQKGPAHPMTVSPTTPGGRQPPPATATTGSADPAEAIPENPEAKGTPAAPSGRLCRHGGHGGHTTAVEGTACRPLRRVVRHSVLHLPRADGAHPAAADRGRGRVRRGVRAGVPARWPGARLL